MKAGTPRPMPIDFTLKAPAQRLNPSMVINGSISQLVFKKSVKLKGTFLKKWANPGLIFIYFCLFKHTPQFLQQLNVKKCYDHPVYGTGI